MPAPKKKSGTKTTSVSKKTEVVKNSATKKKTAKPVTKAKKVTVKPKVSAAVKTPKKAPKKVGCFSWDQWSETFMKAINCWKKILPGYGLVLGVVLGLHILGLFTLSTVLLSVFGGVGGLENTVANLQIGTMPESKVMALSLICFMAWVLYAIYVGTLSKIAFYGLIRNESQNKKASAFTLFFQEGPRLALSYIGLSLRVLFYVAWPILALFGLFVLWDLLLYQAELKALNLSGLTMLTPLIVILLILATAAYMVFAAVRFLFALPLLVHTGKKAGEAFALAKEITKGAWWFTALMWGVFVILLYSANIVLTELAYLDPMVLFEGESAAESFRLADLLAFLISLFIFGPITTAFQYYLMLRGAKNQSVKI